MNITYTMSVRPGLWDWKRRWFMERSYWRNSERCEELHAASRPTVLIVCSSWEADLVGVDIRITGQHEGVADSTIPYNSYKLVLIANSAHRIEDYNTQYIAQDDANLIFLKVIDALLIYSISMVLKVYSPSWSPVASCGNEATKLKLWWQSLKRVTNSERSQIMTDFQSVAEIVIFVIKQRKVIFYVEAHI